MHYIIENSCDSATDEPLIITFLTNPPQQFRVPSKVLHEALNRHHEVLKQWEDMSKMIEADLKTKNDDTEADRN